MLPCRDHRGVERVNVALAEVVVANDVDCSIGTESCRVIACDGNVDDICPAANIALTTGVVSSGNNCAISGIHHQ